MARRMLLALLALALLAPASAQARQRVSGPGFHTLAPSGWHRARTHGNGWTTVTVQSPGTTKGQAANGVRVQVSWISVRSLRRRLKRAVPRQPAALVASIMAYRPDSQDGSTVIEPSNTPLGGEPAGIAAVAHQISQRGSIVTNVQDTDIALIRGSRVYDVRMTTDLSRIAVGAPALNMVRSNWHWR